MRASLLLVVLLALGAWSACKHQYSETDLQMTLVKHHGNLRWGRVDVAALDVKPELRDAFRAEWGARLADTELQELDVAGISFAEDGDSAEVVVNVTLVERASMSVRQATLKEKWLRTTNGWVAGKVVSVNADGPQMPRSDDSGG
jgi:hypothetical protein